jgi:hypothetical protein
MEENIDILNEIGPGGSGGGPGGSGGGPGGSGDKGKGPGGSGDKGKGPGGSGDKGKGPGGSDNKKEGKGPGGSDNKKDSGSKDKKDTETKKVEFPINTIDRSNKFRKWLKSFRYGFFSKKNIKDIISDIKDDADSIKIAWEEYGNEFIQFLLNSPNSALQSLGKQIKDENENWLKTGEGVDVSFEKAIESEKRKCESWTLGNLFEKKYRREGVETLNQKTREFIEWSGEQGWYGNLVPSDFCGFDANDINWDENVWMDEDGKEHQIYQHPIVRLLSLHKVWMRDELTRVDRKSDLFTKFLKDSGEEVTPYISGGRSEEGKTKNVRPSDTPADSSAEVILSAGANRNLCVNLRNALKSSSDRSETVQKAIQMCNSKNSNWLKTDLESRVKTKLRVFQEGKMIKENIQTKLKSKKNEKTLISLSEDFQKQNFKKFFDGLNNFRKTKNLNEATNAEFEKSFDVIFQGKETEFKNRAIEYILNKLQVQPTSEMGKNIKSELEKVSAKDMFKNEYDVPEAIATAVTKSAQSSSKEEEGLKGIVSQSIKFDDKQLKQGVRQHLQNYIEGVKTDIKSLEEKIKKSIIEK